MLGGQYWGEMGYMRLEAGKNLLGIEGEDFKKLSHCPVTGKKYEYKRPVNKIEDSKNPAKELILESKTPTGSVQTFLDGSVYFKKH